MLNDQLRCYNRSPITGPDWNNASESLKKKKLLNARGAITIDGKNAIEGFRV
jgi:hypothetical protein